jgi:hypothetical protein
MFAFLATQMHPDRPLMGQRSVPVQPRLMRRRLDNIDGGRCCYALRLEAPEPGRAELAVTDGRRAEIVQESGAGQLRERTNPVDSFAFADV